MKQMPPKPLFFENIPQSYQGYLDQFQKHPQKAIQRLQKAIRRRHLGAAGYAVLSVLHAMNGDRNEAVHHAWTAGILAPGSRSFRQLPYLMLQSVTQKQTGKGTGDRKKPSESHVSMTEGGSKNPEDSSRKRWLNDLHHPASLSPHVNGDPSAMEFAVSDLDHFINTLSKAGTYSRKALLKDGEKGTQTFETTQDKSDISGLNDAKPTVFSETLAKIHENQGNFQDALEMYSQLCDRFPERRSEFEQKINSLQQKVGKSESS